MASKNKKIVPSKEPRLAIVATGIELLKLISASGGMFLTQAEIQVEIDNGNAVADMNNMNGNMAMVTLTEKGRAAIAVAPAASVAGKASYEIDNYAPIVERKRRGAQRGSKYPFDNLQVNQSFHVPRTAEMPDPVSALASSITGARHRFAEGVVDENGPVMETVKVKVYSVDENGRKLKGLDGKYVVTGSNEVTRQKMRFTRNFVAAEARADDPRGPGARVIRTN